MPDYDDTNRGALFRNKQKKKPNQPDYRGPLNYEGVELEVAGWMKKSKAGDSYMSLTVQKKEPADPGASYANSDLDKDMPF